MSLQSKQLKQSTKKFCKICSDAGKSSNEYNAHNVRENGKVMCPILLITTCRYCKKSGHTIAYCDVLQHMNKAQDTRQTPSWGRKNYNDKSYNDKSYNDKSFDKSYNDKSYNDKSYNKNKNNNNQFAVLCEEIPETDEEFPILNNHVSRPNIVRSVANNWATIVASTASTASIASTASTASTASIASTASTASIASIASKRPSSPIDSPPSSPIESPPSSPIESNRSLKATASLFTNISTGYYNNRVPYVRSTKKWTDYDDEDSDEEY